MVVYTRVSSVDHEHQRLLSRFHTENFGDEYKFADTNTTRNERMF